MAEIITKKEIDELLKLEGQTRGLGFKTEAKFVLEREGEKGLKKLEREMEKVGFPYDQIQPMNFYPLGWLGVALLVIKRLFDYSDDDFLEMGKFEAKSSLIIRLFMQYFVSLEMVSSQASNMWRKYYTVGDIKVAEINKGKKYVIIRVENFSLHPILCQVLRGYYSSILKMILNAEVSCQETECVFKGGDCHQFLLKW